MPTNERMTIASTMVGHRQLDVGEPTADRVDGTAEQRAEDGEQPGPATEATSPATTVMARADRPPWTTRARTSRPSSSVPNQWADDGGCRMARKSCSQRVPDEHRRGRGDRTTTASTTAPVDSGRSDRPARRAGVSCGGASSSEDPAISAVMSGASVR